MPDERIAVEVAFAATSRQVVKQLHVPIGTSAIEAIQLSGLLEIFPEIEIATASIGIFGRPAGHDKTLKALDRVEIYRDLVIDPKEARRKRALKQKCL